MLDRPLASPVCGACWRAVPAITPPRCPQCGDALPALSSSTTMVVLCTRCRRTRPRFTIARSAGRYDGTLRTIVHAFKYRRCRVLARPLAALMRAAGADALAGADAVVPVPLHPWRLVQRGFNQADDLARELGLPVWRALSRRRYGPPQAGLPAARRHANVRRAFRVRASRVWTWRGIRLARADLRGAVVVLIDDVMTTGATLDACAAALVGAGVSEVRALTAARAVAARPARQPPPPRLASPPRR